MFTGLIEEVGVIQKIKTGKNSAQFFIKAAKVMDDTKIGDSICTNGVCLTVVEKSPLVFAVDIMSETIKMTNFSDLKIGSKVNLERAMRLSDRLGGHLVSGKFMGPGKMLPSKKTILLGAFTLKASPRSSIKYLTKDPSPLMEFLSQWCKFSIVASRFLSSHIQLKKQTYWIKKRGILSI